ncbi:neuraminidase-like domain-containing protein [Xenorhabdus bovienii]|uniref:Tc toxin subunit A-related protein n=1 Tax=Xenorhabdus bovienii TaxID=40576 RepID=UPI001EDD8B57|nr:neuraminidase-like domain-containing protein [Xenorhabdus bovienii]MCG3470700.1 neuraminidase-like domain-containing protein [Xenorhabdus bovienii]
MPNSLSIIKQLDESYRDALLDYSLGQVFCNDEKLKIFNIDTVDELYEYLLIDPEMNAEFKTTRVAHVISSLLQRNHAVYNGMEPGFSNNFSKQELEQWNNISSDMSIWASNKLLQNYPENYIDPNLRLNKTHLFSNFVNEINQSRISEESVQKSVMSYLSQMEELCNISTVSGYMDNATATDANFWFLGQNPLTPNDLYWRKADNILYEQDNNNWATNPAGWSEWKKINLAAQSVFCSRLAYFNNRLYLFYFSSVPEQSDNPEVKNKRYTTRLETVYLGLNDQWSEPTVLKTYTGMEVPNGNYEQSGIVLRGRYDKDRGSEILDVIYKIEKNVIQALSLNGWMESKEISDLSNNPLYKDIYGLMSSRKLQLYGFIYEAIDKNMFNLSIKPLPDDPWSNKEKYKCRARLFDPKLEFKKEKVSGNEVYVPYVSVSTDYEDDFSYRAAKEMRYKSNPWMPILNVMRVDLCFQRRTQDGRYIANITPYTIWGLLPVPVIITVNNKIIFHNTSLSLVNGYQYPLENTDAVNEAGKYLSNLGTNIPAGAIQIHLQGMAFNFGLTSFIPDTLYQDATVRSYFFPSESGTDRTNQQKTMGTVTARGRHEFSSPFTFSLRKNKGDGALLPIIGRYHMETYVTPGRDYNAGDGNTPLPDKPNHYAFQLEITQAQALQLPDIEYAADGGQYLALNAVGNHGLTHIRLNTVFASELYSRASVSLENLFSWAAQNILEAIPPAESNLPKTLDFHGANGRYFWEIFFHIPHAVANRLHQEFSYRDAENWYHYIFNPQIRVHEGEDNANKTPYWRVRPLLEPGSYAWEQETGRVADPDAICYSTPERYKKAIFMEYVRNILAQGDALYRRLTRDALTEARVHYSRATSLLGPRPDVLVASRWTPETLETLSTDATVLDGSLKHFLPEMLPEMNKVRNGHWKALNDPKAFRTPVNPDLITLWDTLQQRLDTLHNNLTIDGKPMLLEMYAAPVNPRDLLRAQNSASGLSQRAVSALAPILPYRFRALLPRVQSAVETLTRFGDLVKQYREQKERALQEELVQSQMDELSAFAVQLQEAALEQQQAAIDALAESQKSVQQRQKYYAALYDENISAAESQSMDLLTESSTHEIAASSFDTIGAVADLAPNVFGFATGGMNYGAPLRATASGLRAKSISLQMSADRLSQSEQYRRRREEWRFMRDQSSAEIESIQKQIDAGKLAKEMIQIQMNQAQKAQEHAKTHYQFLLTRTTGSGLYQWLVSQMSTFYFQAYDVVTSLCLCAEACWQYEMGDYDTRFIQPNVWLDNYFGLTAGEALKLQLLNMESAHLKRHERRLEIVKTVSLKQLLQNVAENNLSSWDKMLESGQLDFELNASLFDHDYPGHYLRQIVNVSVTMPGLISPYQNVKAMLTQVTSHTLLKPDVSALDYLYKQATAKPASLLSNPRVSQSIALSSGSDDHGQFMLDFGDERYLPFEGTGVMSQWRLSFPLHDQEDQQTFLNSLDDIIIHLRYMALQGNSTFTQAVNQRLDAQEKEIFADDTEEAEAR